MLDNNHHYSLGVTTRGGTFIVHILCIYSSTVLHNINIHNRHIESNTSLNKNNKSVSVLIS